MLTPAERSATADRMRRLAAAHKQIDADPALSPQGKRERHDAVQATAEREHKAMIDASDARSAQASTAAHKQAFGIRPGDDATRDFDARLFAGTAGVDDPAPVLKSPAQARKALAAAELRGDHILARAIAQRAWAERGGPSGVAWEAVLQDYASASPARNRDLGALADAAGDGGKVARLSDNLHRRLPPYTGG